MDTSESTQIAPSGNYDVMMISTRSSDVTPSSDNTDSRVIAAGSKWA